jgi:hypothetical protein
MTPTHKNKRGARYRYYVSHAVMQKRNDEAGRVSRVPAADVEAAVVGALRERLGSGSNGGRPRPVDDRDLVDHRHPRKCKPSIFANLDRNKPRSPRTGRAWGCHDPSTSTKILPSLTSYFARSSSSASESTLIAACGWRALIARMASPLSGMATSDHSCSGDAPPGFGITVTIFHPFAMRLI